MLLAGFLIVTEEALGLLFARIPPAAAEVEVESCRLYLTKMSDEAEVVEGHGHGKARVY